MSTDPSDLRLELSHHFDMLLIQKAVPNNALSNGFSLSGEESGLGSLSMTSIHYICPHSHHLKRPMCQKPRHRPGQPKPRAFVPSWARISLLSIQTLLNFGHAFYMYRCVVSISIVSINHHLALILHRREAHFLKG